ncbi:MAG TPA: TlpA disulfide reductase family protein [Cytophagales bacterium]|nr:TlpA disulfide reductase family protein [Cytophagales bacterium]
MHLFFRLLTTSLLFISILNCYAQSHVTISGAFQTPGDAEIVSVYKPVDHFFNIFFPDESSEVVTSNGQFLIKTPLFSDGFIRIESKGMPKTFFYAEPGDSIHVAFPEESSGNTRIVFSGNNSAANNLIADKVIFNNGQVTQRQFLAVFMENKSPDSALIKLSQLIGNTTSTLDSLLKKKAISENCYAAMVSEAEQKLLFWCGEFIKGYFTGNEDLKSKIRINKSSMVSLASQLYNNYDPYHLRNRIATTNYDNCHIKSLLIDLKVLDPTPLKERIWEQYEKDFGMVVSKFSVIDHAPKAVQMYLVGNSLLMATVFRPMSDLRLADVFKFYNSQFPNSPYLPLIANYLRMDNPFVQAKFNVKESELFYKMYNEDQLIIEESAGIDTVTTIHSLIKNYFKGKPVFIDYWATWCSPCIAEFKYEEELHGFLDENNITVLYVSIDNEGSRRNWKSKIGKYNISGYHYLANPKVKENLNNWFQGIPRFMLFDENGNILNDNLLKPSKKQALYDQIKNHL